MTTTADLEQLTLLAHSMWVDRMKREGWSPGADFDPSGRLHDALRPFDTLSESDRRHAYTAVEASGAAERLEQCLDYPRGWDQPTPFEQLKEGDRVRLVRTDQVVDLQVEAGDIGRVESSRTTQPNQTTEITVLWPSGDRSVHTQGDGDLAVVF